MLGQLGGQSWPSFLLTMRPWAGYLTSVILVVRFEHRKAFYAQPRAWLHVGFNRQGLLWMSWRDVPPLRQSNSQRPLARPHLSLARGWIQCSSFCPTLLAFLREDSGLLNTHQVPPLVPSLCAPPGLTPHVPEPLQADQPLAGATASHAGARRQLQGAWAPAPCRALCFAYWVYLLDFSLEHKFSSY